MLMKIGELARETGVSTQTIRFYEREGLLPMPARSANGYREYGESTIDEIQFIQECHAAGFTLREILILKGLNPEGAATCSEMNELLRAKIKGIELKIASLRRVRAKLSDLSEQCSSNSDLVSCPALKELIG
jgi:DNA-binding transcriptional MerR regulator